VRDLYGVESREKAEIGVLITIGKPTREMKKEAASAGFYESPWGKYPRQVNVTYKKAPRAKGEKAEQIGLTLPVENPESGE